MISNNNNNKKDDDDRPFMELCLSRPMYVAGSSVLGTVRVSYPNNSNNSNTNQDSFDNGCSTTDDDDDIKKLKSHFISIQVYVAGRTRIDPRWHNAQSLSKLYGDHPCHTVLLHSNHHEHHDDDDGDDDDDYNHGNDHDKNKNSIMESCSVEDIVVDSYFGNYRGDAYRGVHVEGGTEGRRKGGTSSVCFFSTNVVNLYSQNHTREGDLVKEREGGTWEDWDPTKPLCLEGSDWELHANALFQQYGNDSNMNIQHDHQNHNNHNHNNNNNNNNNNYLDLNTSHDDFIEDSCHENDLEDDGNEEQSYVDGYDGIVPAPFENYVEVDEEGEEEDSFENVSSNEHQGENTINNNDQSEIHHGNNNFSDHTISNSPSRSSSPPLTKSRNTQLAYTFCADLPNDIPPTANTATARYFYSAVLVVITHTGQRYIMQTPFAVVSKRNTIPQNKNCTQPKIKIGICRAFGHSNGPPIYVSSTTIIQPTSVFFDRNFGLCSPLASSDVKSLRVADEQNSHCCILTIVGASTLVPGGKVLLQFHFGDTINHNKHKQNNNINNNNITNNDNNNSNNNNNPQQHSNLPCYQVAACLAGEEHALYSNKQKNRTRSYIFDSGYHMIDPAHMEEVTLSLALPLNAPCTIHTDLVEVSITCRVDLAVASNTAKDGYANLSFQFPCEVIQYLPGNDNNYDIDHGRNIELEDKLINLFAMRSDNYSEDASSTIINRENMNDLTMLSLHMMKNSSNTYGL